jgi:threonine aldolase
MLEPAAARARVRSDRYGVPTSAIAVEQTHNRAGGAVQPFEVLEELRALADEAGLHLHCDGARIWNASVATGIPLDRYGRLFDSLSVCFSKGLGAPVGSAVVGSRELVERAREVRHLYGGAMRQAGVLAAAALVALEQHIDRLATDHARARALAETVAAAVPGSVDPAAVETNMVLLAAGAFGTDGPRLVERLAELGVAAADTDPDRVRLVFSYEVGDDDAERAAKAVVAAAG